MHSYGIPFANTHLTTLFNLLVDSNKRSRTIGTPQRSTSDIPGRDSHRYVFNIRLKFLPFSVHKLNFTFREFITEVVRLPAIPPSWLLTTKRSLWSQVEGAINRSMISWRTRPLPQPLRALSAVRALAGLVVVAAAPRINIVGTRATVRVARVASAAQQLTLTMREVGTSPRRSCTIATQQLLIHQRGRSRTTTTIKKVLPRLLLRRRVAILMNRGTASATTSAMVK